MLIGYINQVQTLTGEISKAIVRSVITDHEVVTIDLYQINENEIIPENTNAVVNLAPTELQPTAANTAVNLAPTELQPVSVKIETISANFEEDTEL